MPADDTTTLMDNIILAITEQKLLETGASIFMLTRCKCFYLCLTNIDAIRAAAREERSVLLDEPILKSPSCKTRQHYRLMPHCLKLVELDEGDLVLSNLR